MNMLVIDRGAAFTRTAFYSEGILEDLSVEKTATPSLVGRIYMGRVEKVEPALDAAFVSVGMDKAGYLGIKDVLPPGSRSGKSIKDCIVGGREIMVQVIKDQREDKGVQLTTRITLPGRFVVLTPGEPEINVSHKVPGRDRDPLISLVSALLSGNVGAVIRTEAAAAPAEEIEGEVRFLQALWHRISGYDKPGYAPMLVYKSTSSAVQFGAFYGKRNRFRLASNSPELTMELKGNLQRTGEPIAEITDDVPKELLDKDMADALEPHVPIASGGSLFIETTRACTIIDVNSGGTKGRGDAQSTYLDMNLAAAREIARQMRIRNLSGMILIDFIDMKKEVHKKAVSNLLQELTQSDRMPVHVLGYTRLGILELTRKTARPPLRDVVTELCDTCRGAGCVIKK